MELKKVIEDRRSIRKYQNKSIDKNILLEGIKYGIKAPSAHNRQPWKFQIVNTEQKNKIAEKLYNKTSNIEGHSGANTASIIKEAPHLIIVYLDSANKEHKENDLLSIGACIENIILYFTDLNLGTLWIANTNLIKDEIKKILNTNEETISCIAVGYKDQFPKERPRKKIEDIIIN